MFKNVISKINILFKTLVNSVKVLIIYFCFIMEEMYQSSIHFQLLNKTTQSNIRNKNSRLYFSILITEKTHTILKYFSFWKLQVLPNWAVNLQCKTKEVNTKQKKSDYIWGSINCKVKNLCVFGVLLNHP